MLTLGVSVYPDLRPIEEIKEYLKLAASYGCKRVFSSMFSVEGTKEEVLAYFKELIEAAHEVNMEVSLDVNPDCLNKMGASYEDISVFADIQVDILRMDLSFGEEKDIVLVKNPYGIKIEFNASMLDREKIIRMVEKGVDKERLLACHNFYPQRYTEMKWEKFKRINEDLHNAGIRVGAFISSHAPNTHGVWGALVGLPTVEKHRPLPIDLQLREMVATGCVDDILIGNAYASEEEFMALQEALKRVEVNVDNPIVKMLMSIGGSVNSLPPTKKVKIHLVEDISEIEKDVLFNFYPHIDFGDSSEWIWRSRSPRFVYKDKTIPIRKCDKPFFEVGDVVMVNDSYKHYAAEVQIVLKPIENDGQRNLVGYLDQQEQEMLELIKEQDIVVFLESK